MELLVLLLQLKIKSVTSDPVIHFSRQKYNVAWNKNRATSLPMDQSPNQVTRHIEKTTEVTYHVVNSHHLFQTYWWF